MTSQAQSKGKYVISMNKNTKQKLLFIIPSTIGVLLFIVPILVNETWTIAVKLLADIIGCQGDDSADNLSRVRFGDKYYDGCVSVCG